MTGNLLRRTVHAVAAILAAAGLVLFGLAWYDRYWRWRDCFNELGRCYDPQSEQVFLEQAGLVWGGFAIMCALVLTLSLWRLIRRR
jgi:hypothetical protein